jgi:hypothetical protein
MDLLTRASAGEDIRAVHPLLCRVLSRRWDADLFAFLRGGWYMVDQVIASWFCEGSLRPTKLPLLSSTFSRRLAEEGMIAEFLSGDELPEPGCLTYKASGLLQDRDIWEVMGRLLFSRGCLAYDNPVPEIMLMRMVGADASLRDSAVLSLLFTKDRDEMLEATLSQGDDLLRKMAYDRLALPL